MDLTLNEIQTMLQTSAREFMEDQLPKTRVLEIDDSESGFDPDLWGQMADLGWPSLAVPEEYGGLGQGWVDLGVVSEVMGNYACPSPLLSSAVLAAQAILAAGSEEQKQAMLPGIAAGQQIYTLAYTEPDYSWSPSAVKLRATANKRRLHAERHQAVHPGRQHRRPHPGRGADGGGRGRRAWAVRGRPRRPRRLRPRHGRLDRAQGLRSELQQRLRGRRRRHRRPGGRVERGRVRHGQGDRRPLRLHGGRHPARL